MPNIAEIDVKSKPGFIIITRASGPPVEYPWKDVLRAADIPTGLTFVQIAAITTLANLMVVLIRTLQNRGVLDETFMDDAGMDYSLDALIEVVEKMGGAYHDPNLDVEGD